MPNKAELSKGIDTLRSTASQLPDGAGKMAVNNMIAKLDGLASSVLNDDGTTHPLASSFIGTRALMPNAMAEGDGHAVTCC